jgi:hypothetical protein
MKVSVNALPTAIALASFMAREADAIYLPGIVRLFRGNDETLQDQASGMDLSYSGETGLTYPIETPYGNDTRKVFQFGGVGWAKGSAEGLPSGSEPRTIMGWIKKEKETNLQFSPHPFGYGGFACNMYYAIYFPEEDKIELDQWCTNENTGGHTIILDEWFHFAGTWDGTNNRVYIDGEKKSEAAPGSKPETAL